MRIRCRTLIAADMPRHSANDRNQTFGMLLVGATKHHVAKALGSSVLTVTRVAQQVQTRGSVRDRPRPR